ncbi:hypothetical protein ANO11243_093340 [Dothideomycetidae sp. 11243]|nr:hypothetical protein ANO11243_093340 [fungal sp. No.11243]
MPAGGLFQHAQRCIDKDNVLCVWFELRFPMATMRRALLYSASVRYIDSRLPGLTPSSPRLVAKNATQVTQSQNQLRSLRHGRLGSRRGEERAREELRTFLDSERPKDIKEIAVRINGIDTEHALKDMQHLVGTSSSVSKPALTPRSYHFVSLSSSTTQARPPIRVLPLMESAKGLLNLASICQSSPYIAGLVFAAEDSTLDLGITRTECYPELLYARRQIIATARAYKRDSWEG